MSSGDDGSPRTPEEPNTAVLLRDAYVAIEDVVPQYLARDGHDTVRRAHGIVFQHLDPTGTTVSALAERAGMTKQAMGELVLHLERHGYVRRVPDPGDRRAKLVQLTDRGREVVRIVGTHVPELEQRLVAMLGERRWRQLRADLRVIQEEFGHLGSHIASSSLPK